MQQDKHAKQLADKLAARLPRCETERQWNDVTYALSLLQHKNEEITKLVTGGFRVVQAGAWGNDENCMIYEGRKLELDLGARFGHLTAGWRYSFVHNAWWMMPLNWRDPAYGRMRYRIKNCHLIWPNTLPEEYGTSHPSVHKKTPKCIHKKKCLHLMLNLRIELKISSVWRKRLNYLMLVKSHWANVEGFLPTGLIQLNV